MPDDAMEFIGTTCARESQLSELSLWSPGIPGYTEKARESQGKLAGFRMGLNKHIIM